MVEGGIVPEAGWLVAGGGEEGGVLLVRDGKYGHAEGGERHAMRRAFVRAAVVVAHGERTGRDEDGLYLVDWSRHGAIIHASRCVSRAHYADLSRPSNGGVISPSVVSERGTIQSSSTAPASP